MGGSDGHGTVHPFIHQIGHLFLIERFRYSRSKDLHAGSKLDLSIKIIITTTTIPLLEVC